MLPTLCIGQNISLLPMIENLAQYINIVVLEVETDPGIRCKNSNRCIVYAILFLQFCNFNCSVSNFKFILLTHIQYINSSALRTVGLTFLDLIYLSFFVFFFSIHLLSLILASKFSRASTSLLGRNINEFHLNQSSI